MSEVPKSNEPLEDRKPQKVATPQRERAKKELAPPNRGASFKFSGWGKKKK
jgi:hypothetical protein